MDHEGRVAAVERESTALAAALRAGPLDARVPTCPDWTVADLAVHVGEFSGFWAHVLCEGTARPKTPAPQPPVGEALAEWYEELAGDLVTLLQETPPETEVWTWVEDDQTAGFVARRCAHELAVHRVDAESARGAPGPIDGALAADGIEEVLMMAMKTPRGSPGQGETLHLHGTDRGDEWLIGLEPGGLEVTHEHAKGDLALRGAVSDLELVLYQRPPLAEVERLGDATVLDAWYRLFTF
ncbi:MAG: maleylpyruvate isomerase family mycothiol-dependent enzyme [Actinomycetota bacterium]|nr:maleylpyruvate isomerase family mycothiol-dependent enzyme [Acidimicrobiia bacterium]MDQ3147212.1 maleylpyruvate isomerase family mycothiol-dependent enzyme [Actinomycetota bacterium]